MSFHDDVLNTHWLICGTHDVVKARHDEAGWHFGDITVTDAALRAALPGFQPDQVREFSLVHDGWKVARLRSFRPVIYFCAFHDPYIMECASLAVISLINRGEWPHDIVIFTDAEGREYLEKKFEEIPEHIPLRLVEVEVGEEKIDAYMARYKVVGHVSLAACNPLIYFDVDVIFDGNLQSILPALADADHVQVCPEGRMDEGTLQSDGWWYGWRLLAEDHVPFDSMAPGFSSGVMGFANKPVFFELFRLVQQAAYGWMQAYGGPENLHGLDQRFANYVLRKMGRFSLKGLAGLVNLHRIRLNYNLFPAPERRRGAVHFLNASLPDKMRAMQAYLEALEQT